jgi:pheromone shutdown protein TraB
MAVPTDDPRIHDEYVEIVSGDDPDTSGSSGDVILVGVVHDHPASVHRVRSLIESRDPATVALELSPLAVPLFEEYADRAEPADEPGETPPEHGGEMSAAIRAADCDVVGIDAPSTAFFARLGARFREERPDPRTVYRVLRGVGSVTRHALNCRLGASVARLTGRAIELDRPVDHECTRRDPPAEQASDEKRQASQSLSLLRAFETPEPMDLRDSTREECMAAKLTDLRAAGDVLAVVGIDHLDGVVAELDG